MLLNNVAIDSLVCLYVLLSMDYCCLYFTMKYFITAHAYWASLNIFRPT